MREFLLDAVDDRFDGGQVVRRQSGAMTGVGGLDGVDKQFSGELVRCVGESDGVAEREAVRVGLAVGRSPLIILEPEPVDAAGPEGRGRHPPGWPGRHRPRR